MANGHNMGKRTHGWMSMLPCSLNIHARPQDETPIMPPSYKPVSFILNRPLKRPEPPNPPDPEAQITPMSLPPVKYLPPPIKKNRKKEKDVYDSLIIRIDGVPHLEMDGDFVSLVYERRSGPQSRYPRDIPEPGVNKKPRGRPVPTKESGEREGTTYTCRICHKAFKRSQHMKRHIRSLHMHMEHTFVCSLPFCTKSFARRDNLIQHERKHKLFGAFHDCTKNFEGELFPKFLPHNASPENLERLREYIRQMDAAIEEEDSRPVHFPGPSKYSRDSPLIDDDLAEVLAAEKAEAEARKADLEKLLSGHPPAIGTSRNMPLCSQPVFPADFHYGGVDRS
ncbi:uncharacterized protein B0H18DRAFT_1005999 [Fomitopsis serialis]|uniref:uncharacterized protein n=1 Tax=Fomitopsis serialis TaxID=139415 RepID=UPI0020077815|nr:uncharacterized protein B0H18DRAFT_1005999 [Neoantrodia serialis]KAH9926420.1 hypothetical protein B0H18DRAFT_1005999 [Neoantrodia serialis]